MMQKNANISTSSLSNASCLYVTKDADLARLFSSHLKSMGITQHFHYQNDPQNIQDHCATYGQPSFLIMDLRAFNDMDAKKLIRQLTATLNLPLIVMGENDSINFYRDLLKIGVTEYLTLPLQADLLNEAIHLVLNANTEISGTNKKQQGLRISVASAKGGAGCSTILSNLAWQLAEDKKQQVACADLDFVSGDLDLHFNVSANNRLIEMLQFPDRLEPLVFKRSAIKVTDNLVLFSGYSQQLEQSFWPGLLAFDEISLFCQKQVHYLLWDIPSFSLRDSLGFEALASADVCLVVMQPTLSSIRHTQQLLDKLKNRDNLRIILVLNHTKPEKSSLISAIDVAQTLGKKPDIEIPYCPDDMLASTTLGVPAFTRHKKLRLAFKQLHALIAGNSVSAQPSLLQQWLRKA